MKKVIKMFLRLILILFILAVILITLAVGWFFADRWYQRNRSYNEIYSSKANRKIAKVIEDSVFLISNSKTNDLPRVEKPVIQDLEQYRLDLSLNDIEYACYSPSIYGTSAQDMLNKIGISYKYADLIETKKQNGYGEGSSLLMLIKSNKEIIPIFISSYFYKLQSDISFLEADHISKCTRINKNKLNIKIDSSLKEKALITIK